MDKDLNFKKLLPPDEPPSATTTESSNVYLPRESGYPSKKPIKSSSTLASPDESVTDSVASEGNKHDAQFSSDEADDLITTVTSNKTHITPTKNFSLLLFIDISLMVSFAGITFWAIHHVRFGDPPTEFSQTAYQCTLVTLILMFVVCLSSGIILRRKIHNMAVGYLIMFLFVLTFYTALKGASRAFYSIKFDDIITIDKYVFKHNENRTKGELPQFFHRLQTSFQCCGTINIDKIQDWPSYFHTNDIPESCCKISTPNCGKLLARTYDYTGKPGEPMRMPSGFFLSLTNTEMSGVVKIGKPMKIVRVPGKDNGMGILLKILQEFYFTKLKARYPPGTLIGDMKRLPNDIMEPYNIAEGMLPSFIGCRGNLSVQKITSIGWEIQLKLDYETSKIHVQSDPITYNWMAWKIPMCQELAGQRPFHLASNLNRDITNVDDGVKHMWYVSRGISENFILKDVIWNLNCENEKNKFHIQTSVLLSQFASTKARKSASIGKFFISFVNQLMLICFVICAILAVLLCIVFLIFWKYYSRMKMEVYASMVYAPEFETLRVRHADLYTKHDAAEYDKHKAKEHVDEESLDEHTRNDYHEIFGNLLVEAPPVAATNRTDASQSKTSADVFK